MESPQKPLELILARNLLTSISTPSFLVDGDGHDGLLQRGGGGGARALVRGGRADVGRRVDRTRSARFARTATPLDFDEVSLTKAIRDGRPAHGNFRIRTAANPEQPIEAAAFPIVASPEGSSGAMIMFWPQGGKRGTS